MRLNRLRRREFITALGGEAAAWPLAAGAQQPERMRRVGVLHCAPADQLKPPCGRADSATTLSRVELCGTMAGPSRRAAARSRRRRQLTAQTPVGDEEDSQLGDFIEDKNAIQPIDTAVQSSLRDTIAEVLASLTPREERIIRMRFGLGMTSDHTLEEVGNTFSVTRERIRQIEAKALRKLKHPNRSRILRTFLDN